MLKKKVIYLGNFERYYTTEQHIAESFKELGWECTEFQEDQYSPETVIREANSGKYDFLIFTRTWQEYNKKYEAVLKDIKIPTVTWHLDIYLGIDREPDVYKSAFWKSDYCFTADGGHQEKFKELGINHIWLPPAVYKAECVDGIPQEKYKRDIVFVGSYAYHHEWRYRKVLIDWLRKTYGNRFYLAPDDISNSWIRGKDLNNLYASVKVVVGDSLYSPYYWSDRISETTGRGGFIIHPKIEGLDQYYTPGEHYIPYQYGDFEGLKRKIDYYLENEEEREVIRKAGQKHTRDFNTYENRAQFVIDYLIKDGAI